MVLLNVIVGSVTEAKLDVSPIADMSAVILED